MMDGSSGHHGMMVYGSRPHSPDMMSGHLMAPPFMVSPPYSPNAVHTIQPMAPPQYQTASTFGGGYSTAAQFIPAPLPLKQEPDGQTQHRPVDTVGTAGYTVARPHDKPIMSHGHISPLPSRRSSAVSVNVNMTEPVSTMATKTITANETLNPGDHIDFDTNVDQLMKAIQQDDPIKREQPDPRQLTPMSPPRMDSKSMRSSPASSTVSASPQGPPKERKYICDGPNCGKAFSQKTHLAIHKRTHTGKRPYTCKQPGCNLTFSQLGNLRTHERRHTGERPYKCSKCDKTFAQKGNVKSHEETHEGKKPFQCQLDGCDKKFSQLGNMKTHQNNFHKEALQDLTNKFVQFTMEGRIPEDYRYLFEYFKAHYKNSNKGIKGRGKSRKVATGQPQSSSRKIMKASSKSQVKQTQQQQHHDHQQEVRPVAAEPAYVLASGRGPVVGSIPRTGPAGGYAHRFPMEAHSSSHMGAYHNNYNVGRTIQHGLPY